MSESAAETFDTSAQALADSATPSAPPTGRGKRPRLTYAQRALVIGARQANPDISVEACAALAKCSRAQAYRILAGRDLEQRQLTTALLATAVTERLDDWARASRTASRKGYHQPAKDWLIAAKAIDEPKVQLEGGLGGITVNMAFALPGVPAQQPPATQNTAHSTLLNTNTASTRDIDAVAIPSPPVSTPTLSPPALPHKANPND